MNYKKTMRVVKRTLIFTNPITWVFGTGFIAGLFVKQAVDNCATYVEDLEEA